MHAHTCTHMSYSTNCLSAKTFVVRSPCEYSHMYAVKQCQQVPKHLENHGKTFAVQAKITKTVKVLAFKCFVLYDSHIHIHTLQTKVILRNQACVGYTSYLQYELARYRYIEHRDIIGFHKSISHISVLADTY